MSLGSKDLCDKLAADAGLSQNANASAGIADMRLLLKYLEVFKILDRVSFDLSLARGLDYYTGVIYEAIVNDSTTMLSMLPACSG